MDRYDIDKAKSALKECLPQVLHYYKQTPVKTAKKKYLVCCPFHNERNPSCEINTEKGVYHCFSCGASGDAFTIVADEEGLELTKEEDFHKAAKIIADIGGVRLDARKSKDEEESDLTQGKESDRRPATSPKPTTPPRPPQPEPCFLTMDEVRATESRAHETALYRFMCREWGESATRFVFGVYHVGASKYIAPNGLRAASMPYIDRMQRVVDCKIFHVDPVSGSRKTAAPVYIRKDGKPSPFTWALAMRRMSDRRAKWCNFGDHLLAERPSAKVCVVESEKTALICALTYPERIWVAVGSKQNLTPERLAPYIGRELILFPDRDAREDKPRKDGKGIEKGWRSIGKELAAKGFDIEVDKVVALHYPRFMTDADGNPLMDEKGEPMECKADLADLILEYRHGKRTAPADEVAEATPRKTPDLMEAERIFESYKADNPLLAAFAERMELEAVGVEYLKHDEE